MKVPGQIALTAFPHTDLSGSKLRPVLLLCLASERYDDWVVCMVSSQLQQAEPELDEIISDIDPDYRASGLRVPSVFRLSRLAVLQGSLMLGRLGELPAQRLVEMRTKLARWIEAGGPRERVPSNQTGVKE